MCFSAQQFFLRLGESRFCWNFFSQHYNIRIQQLGEVFWPETVSWYQGYIRQINVGTRAKLFHPASRPKWPVHWHALLLNFFVKPKEGFRFWACSHSLHHSEWHRCGMPIGGAFGEHNTSVQSRFCGVPMWRLFVPGAPNVHCVQMKATVIPLGLRLSFINANNEALP